MTAATVLLGATALAQHSPRPRIFTIGVDGALPSRQLTIEVGGYAPPAQGERLVVIDTQGVIGSARVRATFHGPDCDWCGGDVVTAQLELDADPARAPRYDLDHHVPAVAISGLPESAPTPSIVLSESGRLPVLVSVDVDGDARGDLALLHSDAACPRPARAIASGHSGCDLMEAAVCESQAVRRGRAWRAFERVQHAFCLMDGHMGMEL